VAGALTPDDSGYWLFSADGGVFTFGDATLCGSADSRPLNRPIVGAAIDPQTGGYWLVASDGGVFSFNAPFYGSLGGDPLNAPIVGIATTQGGTGYRLVAADGGVFDFGTAVFAGSQASHHLNAPVIGASSSRNESRPVDLGCSFTGLTDYKRQPVTLMVVHHGAAFVCVIVRSFDDGTAVASIACAAASTSAVLMPTTTCPGIGWSTAVARAKVTDPPSRAA